MKSWLLVITSFFIFLACSNRRVPKNVLEPERMQAIIWDMIQAGEFLNGFVLFRDTLTNSVLESQRWYQKIYELHETNREEFMRSYKYYQAHPNQMRILFDSLALYQERKEVADSNANNNANNNANSNATDSFGQRQRQRQRPALELKEPLLIDTNKIKRKKAEIIPEENLEVN